MTVLAHTTNPLLNPDRNPLLRQLIKKTFYMQFCGGENAAEVRRTIAGLKGIGFSGVILGYAREVVLTDGETEHLAACGLESEAAEACIQNEVIPWARGTLETVKLAEPGDYVALKYVLPTSRADSPLAIRPGPRLVTREDPSNVFEIIIC